MLDFVREHGVVHPREVDAHFAHGKVTNWFGGSSNAIDAAARRHALPRPAARRAAARAASASTPRASRTRARRGPGGDAGRAGRRDRRQVRAAAGARHCRSSSCTWRARAAVARRAQGGAGAREGAAAARRGRRPHLVLAGRRGPAFAPPRARATTVRLLAPFDPVVWDRRRFEIFWGWAYRFEAYTPAPQARARLLRAAAAVARRGHRLGQPVGGRAGGSSPSFGYTAGSAPKAPAFRRALDDRAGPHRSIPRPFRPIPVTAVCS